MIVRLLTARPARDVVPVLLLVLALAAATAQFLVQLSAVRPQVAADSATHAANLLLQQARRIDAGAELGLGQAPARTVAGLAIYPDVLNAWMIDGDGVVRASILRRDLGQPFSQITAARPARQRDALRDAAFAGNAGRPQWAGSDPRIALSRQVLLSSNPVRYGVLVIEVDCSLALALAQGRAEVGRRFWLNAGGIVLVIGLLWGAFHVLWARRSRRLAEVAAQMHLGEGPVHTGITGGDELARVARAVEAASARLSRQAQLLRTVSKVSMVAQRVRDRDALGLEICRLLVHESGYSLAGLARLQPDGHSMLPTALVGVDAARLAIQPADLDDPAQADRPMVRALNSGEPWVLNDFETPGRHPATDVFHRIGMSSLAVVPLVEMGQRLGVLFIADRRTGLFDDEFIAAVTSTAADISANIILRERERVAQETEHQLAVAVRAAQLGVWSSNLATGEMIANDEWFRMLGLHPQRDAEQATRWRERLHPDDLPKLERAYRRLATPGDDMFEAELRLRHADGHWVWVQSRGTVLERDATGQPLRLAGVHTDTTRRRRDEAQLRIAADAFENSHEGIMICDGDGVIMSVNATFARVTGYSSAEAVGRRPSLLSSGLHDKEFYRAMWSQVAAQGRWEGEIVNRRKSGEVYPEWLVITRIQQADGRINYLGQFTDISERKLSQSRIDELARTDMLTGLPNRTGFGANVRAALEGEDRRLAVLMLNVDRFKQVNDSFGFATGDQLLAALAGRLREVFGNHGKLARVSGDEFAALLSDAGESEVRAAWTRLEAAMHAPFTVAGQEVVLGLSGGVALCPEHGDDADLLLVSANAALNLSRSEGQRQLRIYSPRQPGASLRRLTLESQLRLAIQREELFPVFQPQVSLATGELVGLEALVRWRHPERGIVPPGEFIPVAEETGLVGLIGDFMLREGCRALRRMHLAGLPPVPVSVNVPTVQLRREDFLPQVMTQAEQAGLAPSLLELEITESMLMTEVDQTIGLLAALRERGFRVAIDDFGTGYSSLSYLGRLPLDRLKIDQSFVAELGRSEAAEGIVRTIIALARSLHLSVLAEGVETAEDAARLRAMGCDDAQGYHFARPLEEAALLARYRS